MNDTLSNTTLVVLEASSGSFSTTTAETSRQSWKVMSEIVTFDDLSFRNNAKSQVE